MSGSSILTPDAQLDLRGTPCPINFVRTKLYLEKMPPGGLLEVWLDAGEPIEQVPDSLTMAGYLRNDKGNCYYWKVIRYGVGCTGEFLPRTNG
jgi:TusA-related sulfurtransferase